MTEQNTESNLKGEPGTLTVSSHEFFESCVLLDFELNNVSILTHHLQIYMLWVLVFSFTCHDLAPNNLKS